MSLGWTGTVAEVWEGSTAWWRSHGLRLPEPPAGLEGGSDCGPGESAMVFPAVSSQRAQSEDLVRLGVYGQPAEVVAVMVQTAADRPDVPYLLVVEDAMPEWSRGLTAPGVRAALRAHDRVGLSVLEYFVLQRRAFEVFGDHRFDDYTADPAGWSWLPASTSGALHAMAYYYSKLDRVEVSACKAGSKNPRKGAHVGRVVRLEGDPADLIAE